MSLRAACALALLGAGCAPKISPQPADVPLHGLTLRMSGLGAAGPAESWFQFDADRRVLLSYDGAPTGSEHAVAKTRTLADGDAQALWRDARGVLHGARPVGESVSDYESRLTIRDGTAVLDLTVGGPFRPSPARDLADELVRLAR